MTESALPKAELRLSVGADARQIPHVRRAVLAFCRSGGWRGRSLQEIGLALTEVCNNALEHGGPADPKLQLSVDLDARRVVLRVVGGGADRIENLRRALESSDVLPGDESDRGRGLFLIRAFMDRVQVRAAGRLVVVRLVKKRSLPR